MLWSKEDILVKGYTLAYTMLVGLIIIMLVTFSFSIEIKRRINIEKYVRNVEEKVCTRETKEYLFYKMNSFISSCTTNLNREQIKNIILSLDQNKKIGCDNCYMFYDRTLDKFIIRVSSKGKVKDYIYNYDVLEGKIKYIFLNTN